MVRSKKRTPTQETRSSQTRTLHYKISDSEATSLAHGTGRTDEEKSAVRTAARKRLVKGLEGRGAKNLKVYEGSELLCTHATAGGLLEWLNTRNKLTWTLPVVIEAELSHVDVKSEAEQQRRWRDELTLVRKRWNNVERVELAHEFGDALDAVKFLAHENDPLKIEERIASLWRMYPEAAEKLGLPTAFTATGSNETRTGASSKIKKPDALTDREENMWAVIRRGSKGLLYCREVDGAGIHIERKGVWKGAPPTYVAAYQAGEPWRHRIQDEKSKVRRKAKLAKLASE